MKQSIARQYSRHRDHTPSALRLPPPKPPIVAKRPVALVAEAAIALPETPEPLVIDRVEARAPQTPPLSRQARRKAMRAEAKALRREGFVPAPGSRTARPAAAAAPVAEAAPAPVAPEPVVVAPPVPAPVAEPTPALAKVETAPPPAPDQPLPASRALVAGKPRGIALFVQKLRAIFSVKQAYAMPVAKPAETPLAGQLRALRSDLAALQQSLDRMIEGVTA